MKIHRELDQGSEDWLKIRLGKITASVSDKILTSTGKTSSQAQALVNSKIAELLTGNMPDNYSNKHMDRGTELEPEARGYVEFVTGTSFQEIGFMDSEKGWGCSPDGINEYKKIGLEIKCPSPAIHIAYLRDNKVPSKYLSQIQMSMLVSGYDSWVFCSYSDSIKSLVIKVRRDDAYCDALELALIKLSAQIKREVEEFTI